MKITESQKEMGAPYPQERGGRPRQLSSGLSKTATQDDTRIIHPVWPPKAQASLSLRVEQAARDFDRIIRDYNTPRIA